MALDFPSSPTNGQVYGNFLYSTAKGAWQAKPITGKVTTSATAPSAPSNGDEWFNTNDGNLYVYYTDVDGSQWVQVKSDATLSSTLGNRVELLEAKPSGLISVSPTSVTVGSGSATIDAGGLVTFNNTSTLLLNGVFTSGYRNYRIILNVNSGSAGYDLAARWSTAGTPATSAVYFNSGERRSQGGTSSTYGAGSFSTQWFIGGGDPGYNSGTLRAAMDIYSPYITSATYATSNAFATNSDGSGFNLYHTGNAHDGSSRDGIQFYPTGGNITGTLQVYGYR